LLISFEKKQAELRYLIQNKDNWNTPEYFKSVTDVSMIEEVIQQWNQAVSYYNFRGNTLQTKNAIVTNARKLLDYVTFITKGLFQYIGSIEKDFAMSRSVTVTSGLGQDCNKIFC
jgi:hypothetical protein